MEAVIRFMTWLVPVLFGLAGSAAAQSLPVADPLTDYLRVLEISGGGARGAGFAHPAELSHSWVDALGPHPWSERLERERAVFEGDPEGPVRIRPTGARLRTFVNTGHPFGFNDGDLWQGRGLSMGLDGGVEVRWKALTGRFHPSVTYVQNLDFTVAPAAWPDLPDFAYPWRVIDLPQRPGTDAHATVSLGDSELRVDVRGVSLGVSNRSRWWGPGIRNAILLSNNAPGFHHVFAGTRRTVDVGLGTLEAFYMYGGLEQSEWFDDGSPERGRLLTGLVVSVSPDWPRGLTLGMGRLFYGFVPASGHAIGDVFLPLQAFRKVRHATPENPQADDELDQLLSIFMRWALPESGFEVYTEWARTDHAWNFRDFVLEPEHSQGRTLGLRHSTHLAEGRLLVLGLEVTDLAKTTTSQVRDNPTYYEHWVVRPGYTHRGQLMGANVGPGGSAQAITTDLYAPWGRAGLVLDRRVHDNDAFYFHAASREDVDSCCHHASFSIGPRMLLFRGDFEMEAQSTLTRELNRYFVRGNDVWNLNLGVSLRWRPR
jgi:hypothetical protein